MIAKDLHRRRHAGSFVIMKSPLPHRCVMMLR